MFGDRVVVGCLARCFEGGDFSRPCTTRATVSANASASSLQSNSRVVRMNLSFWLSFSGALGIFIHLKAAGAGPSRRYHPSGGSRLFDTSTSCP